MSHLWKPHILQHGDRVVRVGGSSSSSSGPRGEATANSAEAALGSGGTDETSGPPPVRPTEEASVEEFAAIFGASEEAEGQALMGTSALSLCLGSRSRSSGEATWWPRGTWGFGARPFRAGMVSTIAQHSRAWALLATQRGSGRGGCSGCC